MYNDFWAMVNDAEEALELAERLQKEIGSGGYSTRLENEAVIALSSLEYIVDALALLADGRGTGNEGEQ